MTPRRLFVPFLAAVFTLSLCSMQAQTSAISSLPNVIKYSGSLKDVDGQPRSGSVGVIFAIYDKEDAVAPVWLESQSVTVDETGHYTVLLGSTKPDGLPASIFANGEARWIGVQTDGQAEQPRTLLVSVPYALKAGDADTLGGKPLSAFLLADSSSAGSSGTKRVGESSQTPPEKTASVDNGGTSGTLNFLTKWTSATNIGNSQVFDNGTNVGIGTSSPGAKLDVNGNILFSSAPGAAGFAGFNVGGEGVFRAGINMPNLLGEGLPARQGAFFSMDTRLGQNALEIWTKPAGSSTQSQRFTLQSNGNIGINNSAPEQTLDVGGNVAVNGSLLITSSALNAGFKGFNLFGDGVMRAGVNMPTLLGEGNTARQGAFFSMDTRVGQNALEIWTKPAGSSTEFERFTVQSNGNIGVGTDAPTALLDVNGQVRAGGGIKFGDQSIQTTAVPSSCTGGQIPKWSGTAWVCAADNTAAGSVTSLTAGDGLSGGVITTSGTVAVDGTVARINASNVFAKDQHIFGTLDTTGRITAPQGWFEANTNDNLMYLINDGSGGALVAGGNMVAISANAIGVGGTAIQASGSGAGIAGQSNSPDGRGLVGFHTASTGSGSGVYGATQSTDGRGLRGEALAETGANIGVYGRTLSVSGQGVVGEAFPSTGATIGVLGTSNSNIGIGVLGSALQNIGTAIGVLGQSGSNQGTGVKGTAAIGGIAGLFDNLGGGKILSGRVNGSEKFSVDGSGNVRAAAYLDLNGNATIIPALSLQGTYSNALNFNNVGNSFAGNGTNLTNVNAASLGGVAASGFAKLGTPNTFTSDQTIFANLSIIGGTVAVTGSLSGSSITINGDSAISSAPRMVWTTSQALNSSGTTPHSVGLFVPDKAITVTRVTATSDSPGSGGTCGTPMIMTISDGSSSATLFIPGGDNVANFNGGAVSVNFPTFANITANITQYPVCGPNVAPTRITFFVEYRMQ